MNHINCRNIDSSSTLLGSRGSKAKTASKVTFNNTPHIKDCSENRPSTSIKMLTIID